MSVQQPQRPTDRSQVRGFSPEQQAAVAAALERQKSSTPDAVREAFLHAPVTLGTVTFRPLTMGHWLLLEEIEYPGFGGDSSRRPTHTEVLRAAFILSRHPAESRAILAQGRDAFGAAVAKFAATIPVDHLPLVEPLMRAFIVVANSTIVVSAPSLKRNGSGTTEVQKKSCRRKHQDSERSSRCSTPSAASTDGVTTTCSTNFPSRASLRFTPPSKCGSTSRSAVRTTTNNN
jgi:hypothetical protein